MGMDGYVRLMCTVECGASSQIETSSCGFLMRLMKYELVRVYAGVLEMSQWFFAGAWGTPRGSVP